MKAQLPQPQHYSYIKHRRQVIRQIVLPVIIAALLMIGLIVLIGLATFNQGGDVGRWAAISTIWIVIPIMIAGLIVLIILIGIIYLMARALGALPYYTGIAQDYVYIARGYIVRAADMVVKPIIGLNAWLENIKEFFGRITP
jgi:uncharacterized membrane protein